MLKPSEVTHSASEPEEGEEDGEEDINAYKCSIFEKNSSNTDFYEFPSTWAWVLVTSAPFFQGLPEGNDNFSQQLEREFLIGYYSKYKKRANRH